MDDNIASQLRQALEYLRDGEIKSARPILVQILKTNPETDQAWYMLSLVVSDKQKRIYALQQVLTLDPNHDKAKARLAKLLTGREDFGQSTSPAQPAAEQVQPATQNLGSTEPANDLIGSRLGDITSESSLETEPESPKKKKEKKPKKEKKAKKPKKPKKIKKPKKTKKQKKKEQEVARESEIPEGQISASTFGEYSGPKRNYKTLITRLGLLAIVIAGVAFLASNSENILSGLLDNFSSPQSTPDENSPLPTLTPTTSGGGRSLPATWTPSPTPSTTPTVTPSITPTPSETPNS